MAITEDKMLRVYLSFWSNVRYRFGVVEKHWHSHHVHLKKQTHPIVKLYIVTCFMELRLK